jgi:N-acetylmuramoyl-L-alanine amidase
LQIVVYYSKINKNSYTFIGGDYMRVVIDPGHGGYDPGGGSNAIWKEKDLTLRISRYQQQRFKDLGIPVFMTRDTDEFLTPAMRVDRINDLADNDFAIMISNHINNGGSKGAEVIYSIRNEPTLPNMIAEEFRARGQNVRNVYTRTNYAGKDYYFVIRGAKDNIEPMIIEYGFADNPEDQQILMNNWSNLAEGVVKAIAEYTGTSYSKPKVIIHRVTQGESLYTIANQYNTTVQKIKDDNGLTSNNLKIGQELSIYP